MKKILAFILAIFYLGLSAGATFHQHYCMGDLIGTSLFHTWDNECGKCGMKKHTEASKNCCKDVSIVIKAGDSHTFSTVVYDLSFSPVITPGIPSASIESYLTEKISRKIYRAHSPPLLRTSLFIQFQNFRI